MKRLKLLLSGPPGSLKTRMALHFPNKFYIDMESGADWYADEFGLVEEQNWVKTTSPDKIMELVDSRLTARHEFTTLILDSGTAYYAALQLKFHDIFLEREKKSAGQKFDYYRIQPNDWPILKREGNELVAKLMMLDMNVIMTAQEKAQYADGDFMRKIGVTFDIDKNWEHKFDTVVRCWKEADGRFMSQVTSKDRTHKMPVGPFETDYAVYAGLFGNETFDAPAKTIELATPEQIERLQGDFIVFEMTDDKIKRFLLKHAGVESYALLSKDAAQKIIDSNTKIIEERKKEDAKS